MSEAPGLIDTHLHLIDRKIARHAWTADVPALRDRDFGLDEVRDLYAGAVAGSVFMEVDVDEDCIRDEARWIGGLIAGGALLGQICACRPEQAQGIEDWIEEARALGAVGMRRILHVVPDDLSESATFRDNVRRIGRAGLTFDMNFLHRTLDRAEALARACDDMTLVLDHCGTPDIAGAEWEIWARGITRLAALPHVMVKLSGITAYCAPGADHAAAIAPYVDHVLSSFGTGRVVWGSDWPVVNLGAGLKGWLEITRDVLARLSPDEAADVAHRNARRIYGLRPQVGGAPVSAKTAP
ncbi:MAG: amidohydrolase family protein [Rubellimicrobium sp.]|nr:amidohydrolase family protein [Rubellimicrobium sp.]